MYFTHTFTHYSHGQYGRVVLNLDVSLGNMFSPTYFRKDWSTQQSTMGTFDFFSKPKIYGEMRAPSVCNVFPLLSLSCYYYLFWTHGQYMVVVREGLSRCIQEEGEAGILYRKKLYNEKTTVYKTQNLIYCCGAWKGYRMCVCSEHIYV